MNKTSIAAQLNRLDIERLRGYRELLDFYHGRQWEERERRGEKRLTFNYTKVFIDKVTSYLMSGINFAVDAVSDSDEAKARGAEVALRRVYEDNNLEQLDLETEIDCAILGDASYKVIWDGEAKRVRVTAPDVQGIYAWWLGDDTSRIWRVASKYSLSAEETEFLYRVKPKNKTATNKTYKGMETGYPTSTSQKATFKASFGASEANYAWNEWVVKHATSGKCLNRKVDALGTKSSGTWTLEVSITLS